MRCSRIVLFVRCVNSSTYSTTQLSNRSSIKRLIGAVLCTAVIILKNYNGAPSIPNANNALRKNASGTLLGYSRRIIEAIQPELNRWFKWSHSLNYSALFYLLCLMRLPSSRKKCTKFYLKFRTEGKQPLKIYPMRLP